MGNRKYEYILEPSRTRTTLVCKGAGIKRKYSNDEIPMVLSNLPNIIIDLVDQNSQVQSEALRFRVTPAEKEQIMQDALDAGYENTSAYLRDKVLDT